MITVRLIASPALAPTLTDSLRSVPSSSLVTNTSDADLNATFFSVRAPNDAIASAAHDIMDAVGPQGAAGRAFRLELQSDEAGAFPSDEVLRSIAVDAHGVLRSPTYVARRTVPVSAWTKSRPMGWGHSGLVVGTIAPSLPFGGSESLGLAIEVGQKTIIVKVKLTGAALDASALEHIATAVGGSESGFVDVGAYPAGFRKDGSSIIVLELGDVARTPLHRVLEVIAIEAQRFGAHLGLGALLSDAPLSLFTGALATHMGLAVKKEQVIETHLSRALAPV